MNRKGMWIGTGLAVGSVAVGAVISGAITNHLIRFAIYREPPRIMGKARNRIKQTTAQQEFNLRVTETAQKLKNTAACEKVKIQGRDGISLVGHWYPASHPKRVIVAMHGWRSNWYKDFGMIADFWHEDGCSILFAEQRGQNQSDGDYMTFGYMERYDCRSWVDFVNKRTEGRYPIYLAGLSMGASTVLMAAGLDLPATVRGIMADCGFTSADAIWRHVVKDNLHLSYGIRGYLIDNICQRTLNTHAKNITTVTAMQHANLPVLFIHGSDDRFVPIDMTFENYKACRSPKELLVVPGAGHGQSYFVEQGKYEEAVRAFWGKYD